MSNNSNGNSQQQQQLQQQLQQRQRRLILSEEKYTSTLEQIVQRDFFPDIPKLEFQNSLLQQRENGNIVGAVAVRRAARKLTQHEEQEIQQEIQHEQNISQETNYLRTVPRPLKFESITGFHARVTNEDDYEFESNQQVEIQQHQKHLETQLLLAAGGDTTSTTKEHQSLLLEDNEMASDQFLPESNRIAATEWKTPSIRNSLFFVPTSTPATTNHNQEQQKQLLSNGNAIDNKYNISNSMKLTVTSNNDNNNKNKNDVMPPPANRNKMIVPNNDSNNNATSSTKKKESNESNNQLVAHSQNLVQYIPKHSLEKRIEPSQTRFPSKIVPFHNRPLQPLVQELDHHNDDTTDTGSDFHTDGGSITTDLDDDYDSPSSTTSIRARKEKRQRHTFVSMTPLVDPNKGHDPPITTWGTIDSTPIILSGQEYVSTSATKSFTVPDESNRDIAAKKAQSRLEERSKRAKSSSSSSLSSSFSSHKRKRSLSTHSSRPNSLRTTSTPQLTPAALSLLNKSSKNSLNASKMTPLRSPESFAAALRTSYTPKSSKNRKSSSSRRTRDTAFLSTPLASKQQQQQHQS